MMNLIPIRFRRRRDLMPALHRIYPGGLSRINVVVDVLKDMGLSEMNFKYDDDGKLIHIDARRP